MIDNRFRAILPKYIDVLLRGFHFFKLSPNHITWLGFFVAIVSCYLVFIGENFFAVIVWWLSRLLDGCDGIYARKYNLTSKFGAFLDIQLDMAAYSLMVVALYFRFPNFQIEWLLILFCYVLCITGALSLGSFEKENDVGDPAGRGLQLAAGLAEGGETGIAYTIFLLAPQFLAITVWIWLGILTFTIVARLSLAQKSLSNKGI